MFRTYMTLCFYIIGNYVLKCNLKNTHTVNNKAFGGHKLNLDHHVEHVYKSIHYAFITHN